MIRHEVANRVSPLGLEPYVVGEYPFPLPYPVEPLIPLDQHQSCRDPFSCEEPIQPPQGHGALEAAGGEALEADDLGAAPRPGRVKGKARVSARDLCTPPSLGLFRRVQGGMQGQFGRGVKEVT